MNDIKIKFGVHTYTYQDFLDAENKKLARSEKDMKTTSNEKPSSFDVKKT